MCIYQFVLCVLFINIYRCTTHFYKVISWTGGRLFEIANGRKWLQFSNSQQQSPVHHLFYGSTICHYFITMSKFITSASNPFQSQWLVSMILGFVILFRIFCWLKYTWFFILFYRSSKQQPHQWVSYYTCFSGQCHYKWFARSG